MPAFLLSHLISINYPRAHDLLCQQKLSNVVQGPTLDNTVLSLGKFEGLQGYFFSTGDNSQTNLFSHKIKYTNLRILFLPNRRKFGSLDFHVGIFKLNEKKVSVITYLNLDCLHLLKGTKQYRVILFIS